MKKLLAVILTLVMFFALSACGGAGDTTGNASDTDSAISQKEDSSSQEASSAPKPNKLNPKTDFKFGKYVAKYFDNDNKSYHVTSLLFYADFEGVEYHRENYYTEELCETKLQEWDMEFNEQDYEDAKIEVNGVTYYNLGNYDNLAEAYEITDTEIKVTPDFEQWALLSYYDDGTLVLDSTLPHRYAPVGTVYTLVEEE